MARLKLTKLNSFLYLLILVLGLQSNASAQRQAYSAQLIDNRSKSVTKEALMSASTLFDLNKGFPSKWIDASSYLSVKLSYSEDGITKEAVGKNHNFTQEQLTLIQQMPIGNILDFTIDYLNTNSATNEISERQIKFSRCLIPTISAKYIGNQGSIDDYIKEHIIDKVMASPLVYNSSANEVNGLPSVVAQFKVNPKGQVTDFLITHPSANEATNQLVKEALLSMPAWKPAEHSGRAVKQLFTLMVGDMFGC